MNDINERWLRWRGEGGYKKGRGKGENEELLGEVLLMIVGVGCDCLDLL